MIRLPISLSKKYQVNQVNTEVSKKHRSTSTYNKPNILILIKIPCKYLVIIPPFPKVIPPCNYLVNYSDFYMSENPGYFIIKFITI